ncbi:MAG: hypothetical protein WKF84_20805 [Pyrinomonadaceae bacterium]
MLKVQYFYDPSQQTRSFDNLKLGAKIRRIMGGAQDYRIIFRCSESRVAFKINSEHGRWPGSNPAFSATFTVTSKVMITVRSDDGPNVFSDRLPVLCKL